MLGSKATRRRNGSRQLISSAVGLAAISVMWSGTIAQATMPPVAASQQDLQHRLDALGQRTRGGSLPRWSDPDDQKALKDMWDPSILGLPPYTGNDVSALVTMLKAQVSILKMYTTAGHAAPGSDKEVRVRTKYQDEITRSSAFLAATSAALLQAMGDFVGKVTPQQLNAERRRGLDEGRAGVRSLLESLQAQLQVPQVSAANKMLLLDALAANAETIAVYSPEEDRKRYARAASAVLDRLAPPEQAKLKAFIAAMETKKCEGLCALKG